MCLRCSVPEHSCRMRASAETSAAAGAVGQVGREIHTMDRLLVHERKQDTYSSNSVVSKRDPSGSSDTLGYGRLYRMAYYIGASY